MADWYESNWTQDESGVNNSSEKFVELCAEIERLIRGDAHMLINGNAGATARLILAQLAHKHGFGPPPVEPKIHKGNCDWCQAPSVLDEDGLCNDCSCPQ